MSQISSSVEHFHFDAVLYPHRSLSKTGLRWIITALVTVCSLIGFLFFWLGAWPVLGFLRLDIVLIYGAFRMNFSASRRFERLRLSDQALELLRIERGQVRHTERFQPYWLKVQTDDQGRLRLGTHGRWTEIDQFMVPEEKAEVSEALQFAQHKWQDGLTGQ